MGLLKVYADADVREIGCSGTGGGPDSQTFTYTGSADTFVVPAGVTTLTVEEWGGEGGPSSGTPVGGLGGYIKADIAVTPGETLDLGVGGAGTTNGFGAFGGGAPSSAVDGAGDGGGLSHVSRAGTFLVVAAGGGGASAPSGGGGNGGDGGAGTGGTGTGGGSSGGGGGSQVAGGAGGIGNGFDGRPVQAPSGSPGTAGHGGNPGTSGFTGATGGGGGGGYYGGGGGGAAWGSGVGGGGGGGGGSNFSSGTIITNTQGVRSGNGEIILSWTVPPTTGRLKLYADGRIWQEACDNDDQEWNWLQYKTITPVFGSNSITFDSPVTLDPFVEYWFVMEDCAQNAQAQGAGDGIFTNLIPVSDPPGGLYPIFTSTASSGTAPSITYGGSPSNYWGAPTSIAQSFEVTSIVTVTGLEAWWGSPTTIGKWGIGRTVVRRTLELSDGTGPVAAACMVSLAPPRPENFALGTSYTITGTAAGSPNNDDGVKLTDGLRASAWNDGHNVGFQNNDPTVTVDLGAAQTIGQYRHRGNEYTAFGIYRVASFAVSHSSDGVTWSSPETFTDPSGSAVGDTPYSILFTLATPVTARYWRIAMTRGGEWTFVGEVELLAA